MEQVDARDLGMTPLASLLGRLLNRLRGLHGQPFGA